MRMKRACGGTRRPHRTQSKTSRVWVDDKGPESQEGREGQSEGWGPENPRESEYRPIPIYRRGQKKRDTPQPLKGLRGRVLNANLPEKSIRIIPKNSLARRKVQADTDRRTARCHESHRHFLLFPKPPCCRFFHFTPQDECV